ncbi:MAG: hypothetical protein AABW75_02980 [Nanoarchaeota archaeon]
MKKKRVIAIFTALIILAFALTFLKSTFPAGITGYIINTNQNENNIYVLTTPSLVGIFIFFSFLSLVLIYKYIRTNEKIITLQIIRAKNGRNNKSIHLSHKLN